MLINAITNDEAMPALMRKARRVTDGSGLYLIRGKTPTRHYWRLDYSIHAVRKTLGLGVFPETDLQQARSLAKQFRAVVDSGMDPSAWRRALGQTSTARRQAEARFKGEVLANDSLKAVALRWFARKSSEWSSGYASKVRGRLNNHLFPILGKRQVTSIGPASIAKLCLDIQETGSVETGVRVFKLCKHIFALAVVEELVKHNPCNDILEILKMPVGKNFAAIIEPEKLSVLLMKIHCYHGTLVVKAGLKLKAMLMVRGIELRMAEWREFDLNRSEWRIPAIRMKGRLHRKINGAHHTVALPTQAVDILRPLFLASGSNRSKFVFPGARNPDKCMSGNTLNKALRIMGYSTESEMTAHGFRATARTMIVERLGWSKELAELQLAHTVPDMNGTAYNRAQHLIERRRMLQAWADYLDELRAGRFQSARDEDAFTPVTETEDAGGASAGDYYNDTRESPLADQIRVPEKDRTILSQWTHPTNAPSGPAAQHQSNRSCQS